MSTLLIHQARCVATQDDAGTELAHASIVVQDGLIEGVYPEGQLPAHWLAPGAVDEVIDARAHVVIPGMVNTHHHMVQSLTRAVPAQSTQFLIMLSHGSESEAEPDPVMISNLHDLV